MKKITLRELLAEFLGSMFLVTAAISPIIMFGLVFESDKGIAIIANALTVAFVLFALIEIFGPISGAHFNPVVTFIMTLEKKINAGKAALFMLVQFAGGIAGTILTHVMFFDEVGALLYISGNERSGYQYVGEIVGTFILILVILLLVRSKSSKTSIAIGLLVGGQLMATSSTMFANPQVTIARMLTDTPSGIRPSDASIFILMQFTGALLAYVIYRLLKERGT